MFAFSGQMALEHFCSIQDCDVREGLISSSELQEAEVLTLTLRSGIEKLDYVCSYHRKYFGPAFEWKQKHCCEPLKKHKKKIKNNLSKLKLDTCLQLGQIGLNLVPGKLVCNNCMISLRSMLRSNTSSQQSSDVMHGDDYIPENWSDEICSGKTV